MTTITLDLDEQTYEFIKHSASRNGMDNSSFIQFLIGHYQKERQLKHEKSKAQVSMADANPRQLGILSEAVSVSFADDWEISDDKFSNNI